MHGVQTCLFKYVSVAAFRIYLNVVKMQLKGGGGGVGGHALKSHGNYIVDHWKSWKNDGIVFLNFCGNPGGCLSQNINTISPSSKSILGITQIITKACQPMFLWCQHTKVQ